MQQSEPPHPLSEAYTDKLFESMQLRLELAQSLVALSKAQHAAVTQADPNVSISILGRKQTVLDSLLTLQDSLGPYFSDEPEARVWSSSERRQTCREMADSSSKLLAQAMQLEEKTICLVEEKRNAVAAQLQSGSDSVLASTAYQADLQLEGGQLDISDA